MRDPDLTDVMQQAEMQAEQEHEAALFGSTSAHFEDQLPCGCTEYHFADCPILTQGYSYDPFEEERF